ncbi:MAG TPA: 30S ribosomal protein S20 [Candidatus Paceibacterota bacterium]|nr:30S ribosomal protein S20 [Candidatus Paceibacterota bacterium]
MPITKNAKKALRVSQKKQAVNARTKKVLKEKTKVTEKLAAQKNWTEATQSLPQVYQAIDKAVKKGIIKKNTANRKKARLARIAKVR